LENKVRLLVADVDVDYSTYLVRFLSEKHGQKVTVALVNNPEKLSRLIEAGYRADVFMVSMMFINTVDSQSISKFILSFEGILILNEGGSEGGIMLPRFHGYCGVVATTYKYQSAQEILTAVIELKESVSNAPRPEFKGRGIGKIGVYSPIGGSGRTFLAVLIAKYLASIKKKVLLFGFEDISSLKAYFKDMPIGRASELYLGLKTREGEFNMEEFIWTENETGVDILLPSASVSDPCELSAVEIEKIFLMQKDNYDFIVSDMGAWDSVTALKVIQSQDLIIFPTRDDLTSEIKTLAWVNFCKGFEGESFQGLLGRCICVKMNADGIANESDPIQGVGFSEIINYRRLENQDVESPLVRSFVSQLL